jgi:hypothetical protein
MKNLVRISILAALVLIGSGCDETFNPKTEFEEQYVLQCFVESGAFSASASVTAVLARTYDVDGFDPATNTIDPVIAGAEVTLTVNDKPSYLVGVLRASPDTGRYHAKQWVYTGTIPSVKPDAVVSILARLPNGKTLSARTTIPSRRNFTSNYEFAAGLTSPYNRLPGEPSWTVGWDNTDDIEVHLFVPRLTVAYTKWVGQDEITGSVTVPLQYITSSGVRVPIYPSISSRKQCSFEFDALDSAMALISAGEPNKNLYGVHSAKLEVLEYDLPLSKYYSSINGSLDQYSIRTDQSVYSNVGGGIGILGSSILQWKEFTFDERYVARFGYRFR